MNIGDHFLKSWKFHSLMNTIIVGKTLSLSRMISEKDIEAFAELSLDRNPIHFDETFASQSIFKQRIAHGMLGVAIISGVLTELMGKGNLWLSTSVAFKKPIFIGDTLTCTLSITSIDRRRIASINAVIQNQRSETVIDGTIQSINVIPANS
jgi:3-hydroxybutyryl-CoA dehydratase